MSDISGTHKNKKLLIITILCIALVQMPILALMPGIERMAQVFPGHTLSEIQTAVSLSNLVSMLSALLSAFLITKGAVSKKTAVIIGLSLPVFIGLAALFMHTAFWHVIAFSIVLGMAIGFFIPTTMSIMFDAFNDEERQKVAGLQTSFINIGGILMSAVGGFLANLIWYGGYLAFLLMAPIILLATVALPGKGVKKAEKPVEKPEKTKLPAEIFYYAAFIFLFMMIYNVCSSNLSTHLADNGLGDAATAGLASAVLMAGGVASGLVFSRLSSKFGDYLIFFAFLAIFIGFTVLNIGHMSLMAAFIGVFIVGSSLSLIIPQCLFSVSRCVDPTSSSAATTLVCCLAPGAGGFLSPVVFTNLTMALAGPSTNFRFQFVGVLALAAGIVAALLTLRSEKRAAAAFLSKD
ncbi:MAG: MFS transporter [Clostridiales bacterium]|nr:MFS transporter [Clostridiales bacterium]